MSDQGGPAAPAAEALLDELQGRPDDAALRLRAARALDALGRPAEAAGVLLERLVNVTGHEGPPLPCLCKRCLDPTLAEAPAGGLRFRRACVVAQGRVLFFWAPEPTHDEPGLLHAVACRLDERLRKPRRGRRVR